MTLISRIETFLVAPRWLFVRIETDSGIVGWGEASCEGRSETVRTAVDQLSELLIGNDALRIEDHWQVMTKGSFYRGGPILASAVSGLDQALWDIAGKHFNTPCTSYSAAMSGTGSGCTAGWAGMNPTRWPTRSAPSWRSGSPR